MITSTNQLLHCKDDITKTWSIIKEKIGKRKVSSEFPNKLVINDIEITDEIFADRFDKLSGSIAPEQVSQIP